MSASVMISSVVILVLVAICVPASYGWEESIVTGKNFNRIVIVTLENQAYELCMENEIFVNLTTQGTLLTNYYANTHPSQPNYFAMTSDSTWVTDDANHNISGGNIADLLEAKGVSWKSYQETYPGNCYAGYSYQSLYYRKHNPFISYDSVRTNATRCARIVNSAQLDLDLESGRLPQYIFYTPNIDSDGHDTGLSYAADWLQQFLSKYLHNPALHTGTLWVITWDEDDRRHNNHIYTLLLGDMVKTATTDNTFYTHFSLMRTIEDNWSLGTIGQNDHDANPYDCFL